MPRGCVRACVLLVFLFFFFFVFLSLLTQRAHSTFRVHCRRILGRYARDLIDPDTGEVAGMLDRLESAVAGPWAVGTRPVQPRNAPWSTILTVPCVHHCHCWGAFLSRAWHNRPPVDTPSCWVYADRPAICATSSCFQRLTTSDIYVYAAISWWSSGFFSNEINLATLLTSHRLAAPFSAPFQCTRNHPFPVYSSLCECREVLIFLSFHGLRTYAGVCAFVVGGHFFTTEQAKAGSHLPRGGHHSSSASILQGQNGTA